MKCGWFVLVVMVFMLAAGTAMADPDTPDEGGGGPGWWLPRLVEDIGSKWRNAPRGNARPWAGLGYAARLYESPGTPEVDVDGSIVTKRKR